MYYEDADRLLVGRCRHNRKLAHETYLWRVGDERTPYFQFEIRYPGRGATPIVTFFKDGRIRLTHDGFCSNTFMRRIYDFTPFRPWVERGYCYVTTPTGVRPLPERITLTPTGHVAELGELNKRDASDVRRGVHRYTVKYVNALLAGRIAEADKCVDCKAILRGEWISIPYKVAEARTHLLNHIEDGFFPSDIALQSVKESAVGTSILRGEPIAHEVAGTPLTDLIFCWKENHTLLKKPRSRAEECRRTERMLFLQKNPKAHPRRWRAIYKVDIESTLLGLLGFFHRG